MRADLLQTIQNINGPIRENPGETPAVFRRKYLKHQSIATTKLKIHKLLLNPANQKLVASLDKLHKLTKNAFGTAARAIIEQLIHAKKPPHLNKSTKEAQLMIGTYEQIVEHLGGKLELNGLKAPDELQIYTLSQLASNTNANRPKPTCHHCEKPGQYRNKCRLLKKRKSKLKTIKIALNTKTMAPKSLTRIATSTIITTTTIKTVTEPEERQKFLPTL